MWQPRKSQSQKRNLLKKLLQSQKRNLLKKATAKPKKQTNNFSKKNRIQQSLGKTITASLDLWKESMTQWQKATNDTLMTYHDACQRALETDSELLKKVTASWEQTWEEIGPEYIKQQNKLIENIFKETNIDSMKKFQ